MSWKSSWYQPEFQGFVATRMGATDFETDSRRVPRLGYQPVLVLDVIRKAANAIQRLRQRKVHRTYFSEPIGNLGDAEGEAPLQASTEFVHTYCAVVDALTATIINAQAGLNWLSAQPPDLEEVRQALNTIADDGKRAGELFVRLRVLMERSPADDALGS